MGKTAAEQHAFDEKFVRVFFAARSLADVSRVIPMTVKNIAIKAARLRKKGVPLKRFKGGAVPDYQKLAALARFLAKENPT